MRPFVGLAVLLTLCGVQSSAIAQTKPIAAPGSYVPMTAPCVQQTDGSCTPVSSTGIGSWAPTFIPVTLYHARVRFTTRDGRTVVFTSALGSPDRGLERGRPVPVRYPPDNPEQAQVDTPLAWIVPAASGFLGGLGLLVAGVVVYLQE